MTSRSLDLLSIEDSSEKQNEFVNEFKNLPLIQQTVITAITVLKKDKDEHASVGCLVVGTENNRILIMDSTGSTIVKKVYENYISCLSYVHHYCKLGNICGIPKCCFRASSCKGTAIHYRL